jgi:5-azacytidine-induced protein 1
MKNSKLSELLNFLEIQEKHEKVENFCLDSSEAFSDYSSVKVKIMNLKLELEEANKIIDSLKLLLDKQKFEQEAQERFWQDKLKRELDMQQKNYEETIEKNLSFIENLVKDKELKLQMIQELQLKLLQNEENFKVSIQKMNDHWQKEMKKAKDAWITTEKVRKEKWEKEKTKEIKEMTARGLEPEINRIVSEHRRQMEEKDDAHRKDIKNLKDSLENKHNEELVRFK